MDLSHLYDACVQKGVQVLGSGDALHPTWREECQTFQEPEGFLLLPSAEVEDRNRIHHLILMEDFHSFAKLAAALSPFSKNVATSGRPHIAASGEQIAGEVHALGGLIGPAHAFTPWTSLFARYDHLRDCYGGDQADFLELGLSADSSYAAGIPDLARVPFLSNSDAHSADPVKVGREWNQMDVADLTSSSVLRSVARERIRYNAGFFPEVGKYNRTACSRCYRQYSYDEAETLQWRCPADGGRIKKGVVDRARELALADPNGRPPYYHRIPLGEIIQQVLNTSSPHTQRCTALFNRLIATFGDEIAILMEISLDEIRTVHEGVAESIGSLRAGEIDIYPGGGGRYGTFFLKRKHYGMYPTTDHNA